MEKLRQKYKIPELGSLSDEAFSVRKLISYTKENLDLELCFTMEKYGSIPVGKVVSLKNKSPINVYEVEIADDESIAEYYYLDLEALEEFEGSESDFVIMALGELDPREAPILCEKS